MKDIVNIQITPVEEIVVLPVQEHFASSATKKNYNKGNSSDRSSLTNWQNRRTKREEEEKRNRTKEKEREEKEKRNRTREFYVGYNPAYLTPYQVEKLREKNYDEEQNTAPNDPLGGLTTSSSSSGTGQGKSGTSGTSGTNSQGKSGTSGTSGTGQGMSGTSGTGQGVSGTTGAIQGMSGASGATGATQGVSGGTLGTSGITGTSGATSTAGATGATGTTGGTLGTSGATGAAGTTGSTLGASGVSGTANAGSMSYGAAGIVPTGSVGTNTAIIGSSMTSGSVTSGGVTSNLAMSQNAASADSNYAKLKNDVSKTNDISIKQLRTQYDEKMNVWKDNYNNSVQAYKTYISELEKRQAEAEERSNQLMDRLAKNESRLNDALEKWKSVQKNINSYEQQIVLTGTNNDKQANLIKDLQSKLTEELKKQGDINSKLARLKEEKDKLDKAYLDNLKKLKKVGFGSNCPKGVNMNDYILKKKIPCWGCIL